MRPSQVERRTHDYTRHGTLSLFAALDAATGKVIGRCYPRYRGREFLNLREIERNILSDLDVHIIMDNYATHKTEPIRQYLAGRAAEMACLLHADRQFLGQSGRALLRRHHRKATAAASTARLRTWKPRPEPTSTPSTPTPSSFRWTKIRRRHSRRHKAILPQDPRGRFSSQAEIATNSESRH